ncbi:MAG: Permease of the drug/metabolite transporter (DMT) superfamily [uncultured Thiotrichaceae bacterium]|uniref:Permease of the drug/metabolite transporter (DMT) superfamily n=1 Tax=uncultured Thiotrichaceae bacterium TaxID=298394 RepID=A0A6S6U404_9GAMM|nr:MAG: Permease of the drug/metabolite transporter (DMT) superfamily [uncultured Thiotrichaceae bacterium]
MKEMNVPLAFLVVITLWSTTPLTIQWSSQDVGFLFGVTSRMILGAIFASAAVFLFRYPFLRSRKALQTYVASGVGIYVAMLFAYWGARYIPSGWISVIWGISPVMTGILATVFLNEKALTWNRLLGALVGIAGLSIIFLHSQNVGEKTLLGVGIILLGVLGQTSSAVWIKAINGNVNGLVVSAGGLLFSMPLFIITWWVFDGEWPEHVPNRAAASILYLSFFGSVVGFSAYFYLINHVEASRVSLITLVTPVTALMVGHYWNNEQITLSVVYGAALILLGLLSYEWGEKFRLKVQRKVLSS